MGAQQRTHTYVCPVEEINRKTGNVYTSIIKQSGSVKK
jgi:hypothetical protein